MVMHQLRACPARARRPGQGGDDSMMEEPNTMEVDSTDSDDEPVIVGR
eukprot:CAMPEP_0176145396 /NCGR_PEP_ID=MMETSP0120_2-20121206/74055_1 /TAXON_ID=160619 /ORGANISM="Kryptoperidinium foliaceum, Strain CCMP 1326" /LENGTH=47 /DNA_ID= /DNA_START= /DNA_END= /DNA_ORIENTATION=